MKKLITKRGAGKSTEAIRLAAQTWAYLIVMNDDEVKRVMTEAARLGLNIRYPITFSEYLNGGLRGSYVKNVIIDNADTFLQRVFVGHNIEMVTMTDE